MPDYVKGRGSQINPATPFLKHQLVTEHIEGLDEELTFDGKTEYFFEFPKKIINRVESADIGLPYSMNPYQGCEHGCIYCYARNTHQYWGFSAGLDFERKIIIKKNAAEILENTFQKPGYIPKPIMLSGNTDCYQPIERKLKITRGILEILWKYKHPVSLITKNALIYRDIDLLADMAQLNLVNVNISITTLNEELRMKLEPRTVSSEKRFGIVLRLSERGIPVNIMVAPVIPSLNSHEIPDIIRMAAAKGAVSAGYTIVRLNGPIGDIFTDWVNKNYPASAKKILHQVADCHGGKLNDSRPGIRMKGEGKIAESIKLLFITSRKKYMQGRKLTELDTSQFISASRGQMKLF